MHRPADVAVDVFIENHGSIVLLRPVTPAGILWVEEKVLSSNKDAQVFGNALVVEPRYVGAVLEGMKCGGLGVR